MSSWRVERYYGFGAARVPLCAEPYRRRGAEPSLGEAIAELCGLLRASPLRSLIRSAPGFALAAVVLALLVLQLQRGPRDASDLQIVALRVPVPPPPAVEPAPLPEAPEPRIEPEPVVVAVVAPAPRPVTPPPPPPRTPPAVRIDRVAASKPPPAPAPRRAAPRQRPVPELRKPVPVAMDPIAPEPEAAPSIQREPRRFASVVTPSSPRVKPRFERIARASEPSEPTRARSARPTPQPTPARSIAKVPRPHLGAPAAPAAPDPARPHRPARSARATPERVETRAKYPAARDLGLPGLAHAKPRERSAPPAVRATRPAASPPVRNADSGKKRNLRGVPLGSLAACVTDREEDALKQKLVAAVTTQRECTSNAGTYHFLETKNLNAFLMRIERAPARSATDRCVELALALDCLRRDG